jgi:hypothetical protein
MAESQTVLSRGHSFMYVSDQLKSPKVAPGVSLADERAVVIIHYGVLFEVGFSRFGEPAGQSRPKPFPLRQAM